MVKGESDRMGFCDGMSQGNQCLINSFERQVLICMHAHTTVTPFMHDLDIACKNVLISHSSMMHA